jgi:poly-beta-hydroxyalkanoate depolymerase
VLVVLIELEEEEEEKKKTNSIQVMGKEIQERDAPTASAHLVVLTIASLHVPSF